MANTVDICPYSIYSIQFFLLFPIAKIGQLIGLPALLVCSFALIGTPLVLNKLITANIRYITRVKHGLGVDHPHASKTTYTVLALSAILGITFTIGLSFVVQHQDHFPLLGLYLMLLSFFHFSEYFVTSLTNPSTLSISSFLLDQSTAYILAITASFIEFLIECYMFPNFKKLNALAVIGLTIAIMGEITRKLAIFTAGRNFTHLISSKKKANHDLVTHGVYGLLRHPSYAGWFYWAVGSQILLLNPICTIMFTSLTYIFFKDRIVYEEKTLVDFFGDEYRDYRKRVKLWMPISL